MLLFSSLFAPGTVHAAQAACDSLAQQVAAADHDLDNLELSATTAAAASRDTRLGGIGRCTGEREHHSW